MLIFICFGFGCAKMRDSKIRVDVGCGFFRVDYLGMRYAKNKKNLEIFQIEQYLNSTNLSLEKPLANTEIESISKSIYNNYYVKNKIFVKGEIQKKDINEGVMEFEKIKNLSHEDYKKEVKRRQSLSAQRTNEMLKNKTVNLEKARKVYRDNTFAVNSQP